MIDGALELRRTASGYVRAIELQYDIFAIEFQYDIFGGNKLPGLLVIHVLRTHDMCIVDLTEISCLHIICMLIVVRVGVI